MGKRIACVVNGKEYPSQIAACRANGVEYVKMREILKDAGTVENAINLLLMRGVVVEEEREPVVVRGRTYSHVVEVASEYEVPYLTYALLCRKYGSAEKALDAYLERLETERGIEERRRQEGVQTHLYRGMEYDSREDVAEVLGISLSTLEKLVAGRSYDEVGDMMEMMNLGIKKERENT